MTALVRSAALTHFADLAAACGLDARALVVGVGLPPRCLTDPDLKVPAHLVGRLLETAAARARNADAPHPTCTTRRSRYRSRNTAGWW